jgi:prepilin-type processing-associated H-X9-DG protein
MNRRGLTILEAVILLVLAVIMLGVGIVALRQSWETSARVQCMSNLKTIGDVIVIHQDKTNHLPASRIAKGYATWVVQLAPYLPERTAEALKPWDFSVTYYDQPAPIRETQIPFFYCPARRHPPQLSIAGDVPSTDRPEKKLYPGALGDYACCSGDGSTDWETDKANGAVVPADVIRKDADQIIEWLPYTSLASLPHGTSETILAGEKHVPWEQFGQVAAGDGSLYNGDYIASFARVAGEKFGLAQSIYDPLNNQFGSYHPGICQFLFADGSVRIMENSVGPDVLGKLTRL